MSIWEFHSRNSQIDTKREKVLDAALICVRAWTGLCPASADGLPPIGPNQSVPGRWIATGHYQDGILLGPLTGHIIARSIQQRAIPFGLDLQPFDPNCFGGWDRV